MLYTLSSCAGGVSTWLAQRSFIGSTDSMPRTWGDSPSSLGLVQ